MKYMIVANNMNMGIYEANSGEAAVLAYTKDAGYESVKCAADVCGQSEEEYLTSIKAKLIK